MALKSNSIALGLVSVAAFGLERFEAIEPHMGTMVRVVVYALDAEHARTAFRAAFARVAELDSILSDYRPGSELNRLCEQRSMVVSRDLLRVIEASQRLAGESDGAFDITAGPLVRLWREARKTKALPAPDALEAARRLTGWRKLTWDAATRRVLLAESGMRLDVGAIGKGYAASEALDRITQSGIASAMVALSGDIAVSHPPPGRRGWSITLELAGGTRDIELRDAAVSTAGDSEQFLEMGGVRYSHILDPRTGIALTRKIAVSVIAPAGLEADGLDTAISVMGPVRGIELMKLHPGAWAVVVTDEGVFEIQRPK